MYLSENQTYFVDIGILDAPPDKLIRGVAARKANMVAAVDAATAAAEAAADVAGDMAAAAAAASAALRICTRCRVNRAYGDAKSTVCMRCALIPSDD